MYLRSGIAGRDHEAVPSPSGIICPADGGLYRSIVSHFNDLRK